jgi:hypothetical protein
MPPAITESAVDAAIEQLTEQIAQLEAEVGDDERAED